MYIKINFLCILECQLTAHFNSNNYLVPTPSMLSAQQFFLLPLLLISTSPLIQSQVPHRFSVLLELTHSSISFNFHNPQSTDSRAFSSISSELYFPLIQLTFSVPCWYQLSAIAIMFQLQKIGGCFLSICLSKYIVP